MDVKTKSGFKCKLDEDALDDVELLDDLMDLDSGESISIRRIVDRLMGKEQRKKLYDHLRDKNGRVKLDAITDELTDLFNQVKELKNS
jgi:PleD family two-component response regulator